MADSKVTQFCSSATEASSIVTPGGPLSDKDLAYCSVKTGVNDLLDYISLAVALIIPLVLGPCVVGVLQVTPDTQFVKC